MPALSSAQRMPWAASAALAAVCAAAAVEAGRLGLGEAGHPGPGFFPFWLAASLAVVAAAVAVGRWRAGGEGGHTVVSSAAYGSLRVFAVLAAYCLLLMPAGFALATFFFFTAASRLIEQLPWRRALLRALIATAASYGLFALLGVQLPSGYWLR